VIKRDASADSKASVLAVLALITPWLVPPQGGPSPVVWPWLVSLACISVLMAVHVISRLEDIRRVCVPAAWLAAALISSVIGVCQYFGLEAAFSPWMSPASGGGEAFANLRQRNQFATLTNMGLAVLLCSRTQPPLLTTRKTRLRLVLIATTVLLALGNAASSSRTGLMQLLLLSGLVWLWGGWRQPETRRLMLVALTAYLLATLLLPMFGSAGVGQQGVWSRLRQEDATCNRLILWSNVLELISAKPWMGWGWGELDYAHFMTLYDGKRYCEILDNAHNLPLHIAVELGIPVALLFCGLVLILVWRARPWQESKGERQVAWAALSLILFHSLLEYPLWYGPFQLACLSCLWLLQRTAHDRPRTKLNIAASGMVLSSGIMAVVAYAAWDYYRISQIFYPPDFRSPAYRDNTLEKIRGTWLFKDQVQFAEFTLKPLTPGNAEYLYEMGQKVLHYSPEARVVEKLIECAVLLGRDEEARLYLMRYKAAFPREHTRWAATQFEPAKPH